ncbi:alanine racemase [Fictibacillus aquaticus]|uniref:alanine racemase n=1 Tax=Fictibacillus aquaticus TaxID=2021314 RepID=UPI001F0A0AD9|nr:alanine racemase [Fictibacillus aquaticus]
MDGGHFYRDTWAEIDLGSIKENITSFKKHLPAETGIMAIVKANGYGHGAFQTAQAALEAGAQELGVATLDEAIALRRQGIEAPILIMNRIRPEYANLAAKLGLAVTVFHKEWLAEAAAEIEEGLTLSLHVKTDTGMGRVGTKSKGETAELIKEAGKDGCFKVTGLFTHFATADELDSSLFKQQLAVFKELVQELKQLEICPPVIHCGNSAASLMAPEELFNVARIGISMYGLTPSNELLPVLPFQLKEAFSLYTRLIHVKKINRGDTVSYGATYQAEEEEWIGTLPIGYADGWMRRFSPGAEAIINGRKVPIVGRICMDQCMVRLPHEMEVGTLVTLVGQQDDEKISIDDLAKLAGTINYEIPCLISSRVPRTFKENGRILENMNVILNF